MYSTNCARSRHFSRTPGGRHILVSFIKASRITRMGHVRMSSPLEVWFPLLLQLTAWPCMCHPRLYAGDTQVRGSGNEDEAHRISLAGGVRDLAVVEALLASSAAGGGTVPVAGIP